MYHKSFEGRGYTRGLRNACRAALAALAVLVSAPASFSQSYPNSLSTDSVDPAADAAFIRQMRSRMDNIRRTQHRPTVALVLSGGGAKGAAQVGAMKYLEEIGMPVDFVCGTSIGGLVGAMFAMGYNSDDVRELFCTQEWKTTLTDNVDPRYISYEKKNYRDRYIIHIPFHYENEAHSLGRKFLDDEQTDPYSKAGVSNFSRSLPSGYVYGFNVGNLISSVTVGYQDSISFTRLPIPFMCVATDIIQCKSKNWTSGSIKTAMRSTMSIPGLFEPVRTGECLLVDGGTRNNFPADIAKAIGADYIIGMDLADEEPGYLEVNNIGNVLMRFISMLGKDSYERNVGIADVRVKPLLNGYNMLSFNIQAIDTMINRGYAAALSRKAELASIRSAVGPVRQRPVRKAVNIAKTPVQVRSIRFEGLDDRESRLLMQKIGMVAGQTVDKAVMDDASSKIEATGSFENVSYSLLGETEPYDLVFKCVKGPTHRMGLGFRMDTQEWAMLALDLGLNVNKLMGSKLDLSFRLGRTQRAVLRYSLDLPGLPTLNADASLSHPNFDLNFAGSVIGSELLDQKYRLYFSNINWSRFNFQAGISHQRLSTVEGNMLHSIIPSFYPRSQKELLTGLFTNLQLYTMDDRYFPSKGANVQIRGDWDFANSANPDFQPVTSLSADFKYVIPIGQNFALIPDLHWRSVFNNHLSFRHMNFVGGSIAGRYVDQQIPVAVTNRAHLLDNVVGVANLEFRVKPVRSVYLSATGSYVRDAETIGGLLENLAPSIYGGALSLGYDTIAGPLKFALQWNNRERWGVYVSFGYDF